jgi:nicotinamide riboside kinase
MYNSFKMSEVGKFAYVGTSCAGKTTLLEQSSSLNDGKVLIVDEAAREYFSANPHVTERFSVEAQGEVQSLALAKEREAHIRARHLESAVALVCDRSVLDAPVYVYSQGDKIGAQVLFNRVRSWVSTYSTIFLLDPADVPYETDIIRDESEETRQSFHEAFLDFFDENDIPYEALKGSIDKRLQVVGDHMARAAINKP